MHICPIITKTAGKQPAEGVQCYKRAGHLANIAHMTAYNWVEPSVAQNSAKRMSSLMSMRNLHTPHRY